MRLLDILRTSSLQTREQAELKLLRKKLLEKNGERYSFLHRLPLPTLAEAIIDYEELFSPPPIPDTPNASQVVLLTRLYETHLELLSTGKAETVLQGILDPLSKLVPERRDGDDYGLSASLFDMLPTPHKLIDTLVRWAYSCPFPRLQYTVQMNVLLASGIDPTRPSKKMLVFPEDMKDEPATDVLEKYLRDTPFLQFLQTPLPYAIPFHARFEHTHIVGGSGHGKTQLLQHLILRDLEKLQEGHGSIVIIDSQGDMLRNIMSLKAVGDMADRVVFIDPNDIEHPPALNLFDFGLERLENYNPVEKEKLINGAIALYEYLFGALLGAELTQRQGVIFRYLARLMMTVPGATIHTLMQFMEDPDAARPHLLKVDRVTHHFFETQFFAPAYNDTRQRILTRLWGVLSNRILERMFANEKNRLDLFAALNRGSIILINTAKDLLKQEGCEILGRFFIALLCQAAQERAAISAEKRRSTFVYIDEAHDYFDESLENLLNQARKYRVGIILAHQNLDQFDMKLRATVMASTSFKLVGGLSAKDAAVFAKEMNCAPEYLQTMRKRQGRTEFACFVRNHTERPLRLSVPFGQMEARPQLTATEHQELLEANRKRISAEGTAAPVTGKPQPGNLGPDAPELV